MTCYHPLKCFFVGDNYETGKKKTKVVPFDVQFLFKKFGSDRFHYAYENSCWNFEECAKDRRLCDPSSCPDFYRGDSQLYIKFTDFVPVPCGKCIGCRLDSARDWATRMMLEEKYSLQSWFITLTYSPEAEFKREYDYDSQGVWSVKTRDFKFIDSEGKERVRTQYPNVNEFGKMTLNKEDYRNFNKRLLERFSDRLPDDKFIRFFLCGEYGDKNGRPHYHGIYFNLVLNEDEVYPFFKRGDIQYYRCPIIEDLWSLGIVTLGKVTYDSCSYVARYCTKKSFVEREEYDVHRLLPEFTEMSRRPGIGKEWFDENFEKLYSTYIINLSNGKQVSVPKYFYKLLEEKDPDRFIQVKERQKLLGRNAALGSISKVDKGYLDYLKDCEYKFKHNPNPKFKAFMSRERITYAP